MWLKRIIEVISLIWKASKSKTVPADPHRPLFLVPEKMNTVGAWTSIRPGLGATEIWNLGKKERLHKVPKGQTSVFLTLSRPGVYWLGLKADGKIISEIFTVVERPAASE